MVQNVLIIRNGEIFYDVEHLSYLATVMFLDPGNAIIWVIEEIVWIELGFGSTSFGFCKRIPCDFFYSFSCYSWFIGSNVSTHNHNYQWRQWNNLKKKYNIHLSKSALNHRQKWNMAWTVRHRHYHRPRNKWHKNQFDFYVYHRSCCRHNELLIRWSIIFL